MESINNPAEIIATAADAADAAKSAKAAALTAARDALTLAESALESAILALDASGCAAFCNAIGMAREAHGWVVKSIAQTIRA